MGLHPDFLSQVPAIAFPSVGTVYSPTKTDKASGQQRRTYTTVVYADVPCRKAPAILERNIGKEKLQGGLVQEQADFTILCKGNYPDITSECRISLAGDTEVYHLVAPPDIDGNGLMTRLHVAVIRPKVE